MKLRELLEKAGLEYEGKIPDIEIGDIATDSRKVDLGSLFVCIAGERDDGHRFIRRALLMGAVALVIQRDTELRIPPTCGEHCGAQ